MLVYKENEHTPVHHTTVRNSNDTRTPVSVVRNKFPPSCTVLVFSALKAVVAMASLAACLYVGLLDGSDGENLISNVAPYTPTFNCWHSINIEIWPYLRTTQHLCCAQIKISSGRLSTYACASDCRIPCA